jgi:hypothetical protein
MSKLETALSELARQGVEGVNDVTDTVLGIRARARTAIHMPIIPIYRAELEILWDAFSKPTDEFADYVKDTNFYMAIQPRSFVELGQITPSVVVGHDIVTRFNQLLEQSKL